MTHATETETAAAGALAAAKDDADMRTALNAIINALGFPVRSLTERTDMATVDLTVQEDDAPPISRGSRVRHTLHEWDFRDGSTYTVRKTDDGGYTGQAS